jgi:hypothetical protein
MAKNKPIQIVECKVNENLTIIVKNARKVYGHDDSLPFNAEVDVRIDGKTKPLATAWNDGWGGETNVDALPLKNDLLKSVEEVINTYNFVYGKYVIPAKLSSIVELLACAAIFNEYDFITIEKLLEW